MLGPQAIVDGDDLDTHLGGDGDGFDQGPRIGSPGEGPAVQANEDAVGVARRRRDWGDLVNTHTADLALDHFDGKKLTHVVGDAGILPVIVAAQGEDILGDRRGRWIELGNEDAAGCRAGQG